MSFELPGMSPSPFAHHAARVRLAASAYSWVLCPAPPPPCGVGLRRTSKDRSAAAVRFGFVRAYPTRSLSTAASRYRRRSGGTACAQLSRSLVASSHPGTGTSRLRPGLHCSACVSPSPCDSGFPRALPCLLVRDAACVLFPGRALRLFPLDSAGPPPHLPAWRVPASCPSRFPDPGAPRTPTRFPGCPFQRARCACSPLGFRPLAGSRRLLFRLAPSDSPWPRCFLQLRRAVGHLGALHHHARLLRPPLRRLAPTVGETSVRSFLAALANDGSAALSRARFRAPLLRTARRFELSDSSDSPGPFTRTLWA
jgi:hypothetical protein